MTVVAIVGNGPRNLLANLRQFQPKVDVWIGADRGALYIAEEKIQMDVAIGDFDSVEDEEKKRINLYANHFQQYPAEKNETDLELAILHAYTYQPKKILLLGLTGGRLDHELINIQQLFRLYEKGIQGAIIDQQNQLELYFPGKYDIIQHPIYPYISFIPYTERVEGITLDGFYYPLTNFSISWGSTRCISNKLLSNNGTFSFKEGILLVVKSRNVISM